MGKGGIQIECFAGNLKLFGRQHRTERSHIMQAVCNLDQDNTDIVTHGKQQLSEVLGLCRCLLSKDSSGYLGESVHDLGYFLAKHIADVVYGIFGIFHHIVKQRRTNGSGTQSHFPANNTCYR